MKKTYSIVIIVLLILITACNQGKQEDVFQRHIQLSGQSNFRDIGGYTNNSGETIQTGIVFRSGTLSKLTIEDVNTIDSLEIKTVVNFLTTEEIAGRGEDNLPEGVHSIFLPISGENDEAAAVLQARETGDFSAVPIELNYNIHALLVDVGKNSYKGLFEVLADADNYPLVFHCSHGVHRTGTATALLFLALDIPWDMIASDYMLSNTYRYEESNKRIQALNQLAQTNSEIIDKDENLKNIQAFYQLEKKYIEGTREVIENQYGDIQNYLVTIGVDSATIERVKNNLLSQ